MLAYDDTTGARRAGAPLPAQFEVDQPLGGRCSTA